MNHKKQIKTAVMNRFFTKMLRAALLYILFLSAGLLAARAVLKSRVWRDTDAFYWQLHWMEDNQQIFVGFLFLSGLLILGIFYWTRLLNYFQEVMEAMEQLAGKEQRIRLHPDLIEAEQYMNQIKAEIEGNQRLAKEAEQRKNDLVVYLAHDLKTPLTSVIGYLTLLKEERRISPELQEKYLSISLEKAERLEDLINEFFEITRFSLTHLELEKTSVPLKMMLEQIVYEFTPLFAEKNLSCELLTEPEDIRIFCDTDKMQRVLDNLLRNAVLYGAEESLIRIRGQQQDGMVRILVENQGTVIPKEKLARIFEQFYRLDTARSSRKGGAGLGLAIAKEIVELHGGTIKARSDENGTVFTVELPGCPESP